MKNILEMLEYSAFSYSNKTAVIDRDTELTYHGLMDGAQRVGSSLLDLKVCACPIVIYLDKNADVILSMLGIVYSGNIYTVIETNTPVERIKKIFTTLCPAAVITDHTHYGQISELCSFVLFIEDIKRTSIDKNGLSSIRKKQIDTDAVYILYTSGSTGIPKGTVINHRNILSYSKWFVDAFDIGCNEVIANQTPFCFSMSVTDIYSSLRSGATLLILPKICFSFPYKLVEYLNNYKVTMIYWVPSAFGIVANTNIFSTLKPIHLKKVLFAGEVMPVKYLNYWINHLDSSVVFANLFGPTETTDICTYYIIDRPFQNSDSLPIGRSCDNCNTFVINNDGKEAKENEEGELYVRGSFVSPGYYNNKEKTEKMFVQNPLNKSYPEICYKTGDIVKVGQNEELYYIGRKDFQIKRMGYRIELGEIESAVSSLYETEESACIFDKLNNTLCVFYTSRTLDEKKLRSFLEQKLPKYFMPDIICRLKNMPHNQNSKIDRNELEKRLTENYE
ncbi:MAG: amino acid adenylation domain-containing protein [Clostridia bacterium]|nr:amino acid adenylation domain-containing protein [Clostridia bacterium]MBR6940237.1 amino acid adenylation domain-containing protein [Clostridia bacterium]